MHLFNNKTTEIMSQPKLTKTQTLFLSGSAIRPLLFSLLLLFCAAFNHTCAQATMSIQGILKKTDGSAVSDGTYNMTFRLYQEATGGTSIWTEQQSDVEVSSGIYSTILGNITPLSPEFSQIYFLGVSIGAAELTPRIRLTSAPYALSLIGLSNQFPSSGQVLADKILIDGGVLAKAGAPGTNVVNRSGYGFKDDIDTGVFSDGNGKTTIYSDNVAILGVLPDGVKITGTLTVTDEFSTSSLNLLSGGSIKYAGKSDWRLVFEDNLEGGANGWGAYNALQNQNNGWNNATNSGAPVISGSTSDFTGLYLYPNDNNQVLKKNYDLSAVGDFTQIKVTFKYFFIDTWGFGDDDRAWAAFATSASGAGMRVGWDYIASALDGTGEFTSEFRIANNFNGVGATTNSDFMRNGEMTAHRNGNNFWLFIGAALEEDTANERYGVGAIEVWVK